MLSFICAWVLPFTKLYVWTFCAAIHTTYFDWAEGSAFYRMDVVFVYLITFIHFWRKMWAISHIYIYQMNEFKIENIYEQFQWAQVILFLETLSPTTWCRPFFVLFSTAYSRTHLLLWIFMIFGFIHLTFDRVPQTNTLHTDTCIQNITHHCYASSYQPKCFC